MRTTIIATLLVALFSCNSETRTSKPFVIHGDTLGWSDSLYIDFQGGYYSDSLTVFVNGEPFTTFTDLTTDPVWSWAGATAIPISTTESISVCLFRTDKTDSLTLELPTNNFIGISNYAERGWHIETSKEPFIYE
ncbi:hypothetical protein [Marinoscillum sp. MHG1-6]|uniref:hypothetical protein n=1 Tax=Marinoscillum sp. MHG1-6 TaxID=2959627 RepID=UPI00215858AA|nr:hypothetical protein [Marinoscillum sp. MHG1-6]